MTIGLQVHDSRVQNQLPGACFHQWILPDGTYWTRFHRHEAGYLLRFPELADFLVSLDGYAVRCWPVPGVSGGSIQHLFLNQVLPLAQSRHGKLTFHASAVEIDGQCIVFMGQAGQGKSTLAASFATNGFRFLTDDSLGIEVGDAQTMAVPSHPSIRLWRDSQEALMAEGATIAPPVQYTSKSRFLAGESIAFCDQKRPLRCIYILGQGDPVEAVFEPVSPGAALKELVANSFLLDFEESAALAAHFNELADIVGRHPVFRLTYRRRFDDLARVRQAIVQHAKQD